MNADYQCIPCQENCLLCSSSKVCQKCASGFFVTKYPNGDELCTDTCPAGTKPSTSSLYYLNKNLFTVDQIVSVFTQSSFFNPDTFVLPSTSTSSVAIDISGKPIFDTSELKWTYSNGVPSY